MPPKRTTHKTSTRKTSTRKSNTRKRSTVSTSAAFKSVYGHAPAKTDMKKDVRKHIINALLRTLPEEDLALLRGHSRAYGTGVGFNRIYANNQYEWFAEELTRRMMIYLISAYGNTMFGDVTGPSRYSVLNAKLIQYADMLRRTNGYGKKTREIYNAIRRHGARHMKVWWSAYKPQVIAMYTTVPALQRLAAQLRWSEPYMTALAALRSHLTVPQYIRAAGYVHASEGPIDIDFGDTDTSKSAPLDIDFASIVI